MAGFACIFKDGVFALYRRSSRAGSRRKQSRSVGANSGCAAAVAQPPRRTCPRTDFGEYSSSADFTGASGLPFPAEQALTSQPAQNANHGNKRPKPAPEIPVDANGQPIPLERRQPQRILGFMPNFRSVSSGSTPHPPGWKYNFTVATHQATDYSSFIFLGITTLSAEGVNEHPVLGKGADGFYAYLWRGFLDKTDGTYLSAWLLPSLIHEDTRNYALGNLTASPSALSM